MSSGEAVIRGMAVVAGLSLPRDGPCVPVRWQQRKQPGDGSASPGHTEVSSDSTCLAFEAYTRPCAFSRGAQGLKDDLRSQSFESVDPRERETEDLGKVATEAVKRGTQKMRRKEDGTFRKGHEGSASTCQT